MKLPREILEDPHVRVRAAGRGPEGSAPRLDADTDDVLAEAGIAPTTVARLVRRGIVSGEQSPERAARASRLGLLLARMAERGRGKAA